MGGTIASKIEIRPLSILSHVSCTEQLASAAGVEAGAAAAGVGSAAVAAKVKAAATGIGAAAGAVWTCG
eukprot:scaffold9249_cov86-Skeletonema_dohrnii-CCMP3373.AAC.1